MSTADVLKQVKSTLADSSSLGSVQELTKAIDSCVLELLATGSPANSTSLNELLDGLENIYNLNQDVRYEHIGQLFVEVLYHLKPALSSTHFISTWFEMVLRPALRYPSLPVDVVDHAKELVVFALVDIEDVPEKVGEFRRRVFDLYLLDALNEGSPVDALEVAELDDWQREKRLCWKMNLEDILLRFGLRKPKELLTGLYHCFSSPTTRLQILNLLDCFVSNDSFSSVASALVSHPLMRSILMSLQVDMSTTVCTLAISVTVKLLPVMAIEAYSDLKAILPQLLFILGRLICWHARRRSGPLKAVGYAALTEGVDAALVKELEDAEKDEMSKEIKRLEPKIRENMQWERLEHSFDLAVSIPPSPKLLFAFLYFIFPCNTILFLRQPSTYLKDADAESPFDIEWDDALDEAQLKTESEALVRGFVTHPFIIWRDARAELEHDNPWTSFDVPRIVSECTMLAVNHAAEVTRHCVYADGPDPIKAFMDTQNHEPLQDLIARSVQLKFGEDLDEMGAEPAWLSKLLNRSAPSSGTSIISTSSLPTPSSGSGSSSPDGGIQSPSHVSEALSQLQREVLLLRNELGLELWLKREYVLHIGRLYQDRLVSKTAELERQGLHNKLREYKAQLAQMQKQQKQHQKQLNSMKQKYADWNTQLKAKLDELRLQQKTWLGESKDLKGANAEANNRLKAQAQLLAKAQKSVFLLETEIKENAPKVDRLKDYEKRIEQLTEMEKMWNKDVQLYAEQSKRMELLNSEYQQTKFLVNSYEKTNETLHEENRQHRQRIGELEAQLRARQPPKEPPFNLVNAIGARRSEESKALVAKNVRLQAQNDQLQEDVATLKAEIERLRFPVDSDKPVAAK